jgi:hypothetical protein
MAGISENKSGHDVESVDVSYLNEDFAVFDQGPINLDWTMQGGATTSPVLILNCPL